MKTTADGLIRRNKTKRLLPDSVLFHSGTFVPSGVIFIPSFENRYTTEE